jgi:hypothetical protein
VTKIERVAIIEGVFGIGRICAWFSGFSLLGFVIIVLPSEGMQRLGMYWLFCPECPEPRE